MITDVNLDTLCNRITFFPEPLKIMIVFKSYQ